MNRKEFCKHHWAGRRSPEDKILRKDSLSGNAHNAYQRMYILSSHPQTSFSPGKSMHAHRPHAHRLPDMVGS